MESNTIAAAESKPVSSHAKRRQQKKMKKENEVTVEPTPPAAPQKQEQKKDNRKRGSKDKNGEQKVRDELINKNKYPEEEKKSSKDTDMKDETAPSQSENSSIKNADDRKNKKRNYTKKPMDA